MVMVNNDAGDTGDKELDGSGGDRRRTVVWYMERRYEQHTGATQTVSSGPIGSRNRLWFGPFFQATGSLS